MSRRNRSSQTPPPIAPPPIHPLRRLLRRHVLLGDEQYVGVLLPPGAGGFLANMALALDRRVAVNLNYTVSSEVMNACIKMAGIKHVLTSRKFMEKMDIQLDAEVVYLEDFKDKPTTADKAISWMQSYAVPAGILALSLCYGAYMTEIFRAGIQSINRGQTEGATALGLSPAQTMMLVILPQAMRVIIPPTGNQFIAMLKDSSLVSVVGVWEIMYLARTQGQTEFRHIEMLITASMIYWILSIGLEYAQARIEERFGRFNVR